MADGEFWCNLGVFCCKFASSASVCFFFSHTVDNGLNPMWNEPCEFDILCPDLAFLRVVIQDEDMFGDPNFLGQATYPLKAIKEGKRKLITLIRIVYIDTIDLVVLCHAPFELMFIG